VEATGYRGVEIAARAGRSEVVSHQRRFPDAAKPVATV